jgi:hypothetical protein
MAGLRPFQSYWGRTDRFAGQYPSSGMGRSLRSRKPSAEVKVEPFLGRVTYHEAIYGIHNRAVVVEVSCVDLVDIRVGTPVHQYRW